MSTRPHQATSNRVASSTPRVAVVGSWGPVGVVCDALAALRASIALDVLGVDGRFGGGGPVEPGDSVRLIYGFGREDRVDRFDLSARYDAVVYAFDSDDAHLFGAFVRCGHRLINDRGLLLGSVNEFVCGGKQHSGRQDHIATPRVVASRICSIVSDPEYKSMGWSAVDPAYWIATQYPNAVIFGGEYGTDDTMYDVSA